MSLVRSRAQIGRAVCSGEQTTCLTWAGKPTDSKVVRGEVVRQTTKGKKGADMSKTNRMAALKDIVKIVQMWQNNEIDEIEAVNKIIFTLSAFIRR